MFGLRLGQLGASSKLWSESALWPSGASSPGLWIDPSYVSTAQRVNLLTYSEDLSNAAWTKTNCTATSGQTDPLGGTTAFLVTATGANGRTARSDAPASVTSGVSHTVSVWLKRKTGTGSVQLYCSFSAAGFSPDLAITSEWVRYTYSFTATGTGSDLRIPHINTAGDEVYVWGAQLNLGSTALTYQAIPTTFPLAWLDGTANYQDSAGTTPISTVGTVLDSSNPVGLVLDRKGGLQLWAELVTNGDFSNGGTGWSLGTGWSVSGGAAGGSGINNYKLTQNINSVENKTYQVVFTLTRSAGSVRVGVGKWYDTGYGIFNASGTYTVFRIGRADDTSLHFYPEGGFTGSIDNISVREIPGLHLSQSTSAARPVASGRKNLLVGTDALATQSVTVIAAQCVLSFTGTGTVTLSGVSTAGPLVGTGAADRVSLTFTPTAGSLTLTVSGSVTFAQLEYRA